MTQHAIVPSSEAAAAQKQTLNGLPMAELIQVIREHPQLKSQIQEIVARKDLAEPAKMAQIQRIVREAAAWRSACASTADAAGVAGTGFGTVTAAGLAGTGAASTGATDTGASVSGASVSGARVSGASISGASAACSAATAASAGAAAAANAVSLCALCTGGTWKRV